MTPRQCKELIRFAKKEGCSAFRIKSGDTELELVFQQDMEAVALSGNKKNVKQVSTANEAPDERAELFMAVG